MTILYRTTWEERSPPLPPPPSAYTMHFAAPWLTNAVLFSPPVVPDFNPSKTKPPRRCSSGNGLIRWQIGVFPQQHLLGPKFDQCGWVCFFSSCFPDCFIWLFLYILIQKYCRECCFLQSQRKLKSTSHMLFYWERLSISFVFFSQKLSTKVEEKYLTHTHIINLHSIPFLRTSDLQKPKKTNKKTNPTLIICQ